MRLVGNIQSSIAEYKNYLFIDLFNDDLDDSYRKIVEVNLDSLTPELFSTTFTPFLNQFCAATTELVNDFIDDLLFFKLHENIKEKKMKKCTSDMKNKMEVKKDHKK